MKKWLLRAVMMIAALMSVTLPVHAARPSKAMTLFVDFPVETGSGKVLSAAEQQQAVKRAGLERNWVITQQDNGTLRGHLSIRTHTLDVVIRLNGQTFDVAYLDSTNLGYGPNPEDPLRPLIHPAYNTWVNNLVADIKREFLRL